HHLELLGLQSRDAPVELLLVWQVDAEALPGRVGERVPVVMERRVDVQRDSHRPYAILLAMTDVQTPPVEPRPSRYGPDRRSPWLDVDWREHQRWIDVAGAPVNVIDIGEGPAIVFIHGLSGAWVNWLENIPHFAREHRVIAMDLPGFGHSPM